MINKYEDYGATVNLLIFVVFIYFKDLYYCGALNDYPVKKLLFVLLLVSSGAFAQTFYVEPTEKGFEKKITEKLNYDGFKLSNDPTNFDYKIECLIRQTSKFNSMYIGYIRITDKSGKEVAHSEEVRRGAVAVNGFNAGANIFGVIADKHLPKILKNLKTS